MPTNQTVTSNDRATTPIALSMALLARAVATTTSSSCWVLFAISGLPFVTPDVALALLVNFCVIVGFLWKGLSVLIGVRDEIKDMALHIGHRNPPDGLMGDMDAVKKETLRHRDRIIRLEVEHGLKIEDRT